VRSTRIYLLCWNIIVLLYLGYSAEIAFSPEIEFLSSPAPPFTCRLHVQSRRTINVHRADDAKMGSNRLRVPWSRCSLCNTVRISGRAAVRGRAAGDGTGRGGTGRDGAGRDGAGGTGGHEA